LQILLITTYLEKNCQLNEMFVATDKFVWTD
jgi:hypothetical protein